MHVRFAALAILVSACGDKTTDPTDSGATDTDTDTTDTTGGTTLFTEDCPDPQAVNTICADISGFGSRVFTVTNMNGGQAVSSVDGVGIGIIHLFPNDPVLDEGTTDCTGVENVYFAPGGDVYYADEGGECSITVTTGGNWENEPLAGTFTATVYTEAGASKTITGSFSYDKTQL